MSSVLVIEGFAIACQKIERTQSKRSIESQPEVLRERGSRERVEWDLPAIQKQRLWGCAHLFRPTYPDFLHGAPPTPACAAFIKESRMEFANASKLNRKSGVHHGEGHPSDFLWTELGHRPMRLVFFQVLGAVFGKPG